MWPGLRLFPSQLLLLCLLSPSQEVEITGLLSTTRALDIFEVTISG